MDSPTISLSNVSSNSDDGGFLATHFDFRNRMLWRKPLIGYPSQLSMRSEGSGQSTREILAHVQTFDQPLFQYLPEQIIPTISRNNNVQQLYSTSPSYLNDFPDSRTDLPNFSQLKSVHEQYSRELPSLRTIHCESYQQFQPAPYRQSTQRSLPPVHKAHQRIESNPELLLRTDHLQASPESQSSSSGFGSKYTSSHQNQSSSHSEPFHTYDYNNPLLIDYWLQHPFSNCDTLDFWSYNDNFSLNPKGQTHYNTHQHLPIDVGSVDGHYEFDRVTPITATPIPSTPTNHFRDDFDSSLSSTLNRKWSSRYDDIDARVQAMKEEFFEFRRRQAAATASAEVCHNASSYL